MRELSRLDIPFCDLPRVQPRFSAIDLRSPTFFLSFLFSSFSLVRSDAVIVRDEVHVHHGEFERYLESNLLVVRPGPTLSIRSVDVCTSRAISTK